MSATVDNRVVEMGFNNQQFEKGVKQSTDSLEGLKKSLDLTESARNISALSAEGKKFSLATMGEGVAHISSRFSALGAIGFTVIQNLTNAAINYGRKLVSSIMDPMKTGFAEYETQINAIQTVLANTEKEGTTLKDVTKALDELNTYADKTIYNFTEMTRNIGTFTAAGVSLDTSVAAIKGIANLAAVSGSNSQQASTAMYQLSQALSSGTVKLMDWNSVVNAGMGGQVFQDALKETARLHGIAIDEMIKNEGSFRDTLQEGWLSSDILLETLEKFTGDLTKEQLISLGYTEEQTAAILKLGQTANDAATKVKTFTQLKETLQEAIQSGWTKSWEIIIGDFEEAKAFFTEVSDTLGALIGESADARNALLQGWSDLGGREALINTIRNAFNGLLSIMAPIKEAFREIFPPITAEQLYKLTSLLETLSSKLILSSENADRVKRIFAGLFSIFAIIRDVVVTLGEAIFGFAEGLNVSGGGILEFLANMGDYLVALREGTDISGSFAEAAGRIKEGLLQGQAAIENFVKVVQEKFEAIKRWFSELFENVDTSGFTEFLGKMEVRLEPLSFIAKTAAFLLGGILKIGKKLMPVLFKVAGAVGEFVFNLGASIFESIKNINFSEILDLINSGLFGALLLAIRQFMKSGSGFIDEASGVFGGIGEILDGVRGSLEAYQQNLKAKTLMSIAIAIGILAVSLAVIASIDSAKLTVAMGVLTGVFVELIGAMAAFQKLGGGGALAAVSLIAMATAVLILAGAVAILARIDPASVSSALSTIFGLMAGIALFSKVMSNIKGNLITSSIGLIAFGLALRVIAGVVQQLAKMKPEEMSRGLLGIGAMLAEIAIFMRIVNNAKMAATTGAAMIGMAVAILILAQTVEKFGQMDVAQMQQGLLAIGALLLELGLFTKLTGGTGMITTAAGMAILAGAMFLFAEVVSRLGQMSWEEIAKGLAAMGGALLLITIAVNAMPKSIIFIAPSLLAVAASLLVMSKALKQMGKMSWEEIGKGLLVLASSLGILVIALYAMSGTIAGSIALAIAAASLLMLAPALKMLGGMSIVEIGLALLTLAGVFLILGIAGYALTPVVPTLLGLGLSIMLLGAGAALVGLGLLAFAIGLTTLAAAGTAAAVVIVGMVATLLGLIPLIITTLIDAIILFAKGLIEAAPVLAEAITTIIMALLQMIIDISPKLFEALGVLLDELIQLMRDKIPDFIAATIELLVALLEEIAANMPDFIQAGWDILIAFLEGIRDNIGEAVETAIEIVTEFLDAVAAKIPDVIQSGIDLMIAFIQGLADGIRNNMDTVNEAIADLASAIIEGLVEGIAGGAYAVWKALKKVVDDAIAKLMGHIDAHSPSRLFAEIAETIPEGLAMGINRTANIVAGALIDLADDAVSGIDAVTSRIAEAVNREIDINPVIRPVMDMEEIIAGGLQLDRTLSGARSLNLVPALNLSSAVASGMRTPYYVDPQIPQTEEEYRIQMIQNNYSPKALSRLEIYRQTRNQILALKGLVEP